MDTIVAISTATGAGGIGIIRMSGDKCFNVLEKIFSPYKKENIDKINGYTMKYGHIVDPIDSKKIDEVLVSYFKAPKSYTTENMCEINSHGTMVVIKSILELCIKNGARLATPGEFTKRAFLNGRIDLAQSEAIIDIISAKGKKEAQAAINQLEGVLSKSLSEIRKDTLSILADIEATIDYPEYDIEEITEEKVVKNLNIIKDKLKKLEKSFESGRIIKDGIKIAIIGKPNAGKSSLLNAILKEDRAIVTEYEGTTRDTIEEYIIIEGIPIKIIDTAGIRESDNKVELIGIEKTKKIAEESDLIIAMFDNSEKLTKEDIKILDIIKNKKAIIVLNKLDKESKHLEKNEKLMELNKKVIKISALKKQGIEEIYNEIIKMFNINEIEIGNEVMVTNIRHKELIQKAKNHGEKAIKSIKEGLPIDIVSINIKEILEDLGKITGESVTEDIIKEIFSKFCLGK